MEIVINCTIYNKFSDHYKIKHILMKKSTKNTFPGKKHHCEKKHKKTLLFFKNTCYEDC